MQTPRWRKKKTHKYVAEHVCVVIPNHKFVHAHAPCLFFAARNLPNQVQVLLYSGRDTKCWDQAASCKVQAAKTA